MQFPMITIYYISNIYNIQQCDLQQQTIFDYFQYVQSLRLRYCHKTKVTFFSNRNIHLLIDVDRRKQLRYALTIPTVGQRIMRTDGWTLFPA